MQITDTTMYVSLDHNAVYAVKTKEMKKVKSFMIVMTDRLCERDRWTWSLDEEAITRAAEAAASGVAVEPSVQATADAEKRDDAVPTKDEVYRLIEAEERGDEIAADLLMVVRHSGRMTWVREAVRSMSEEQCVSALRAMTTGVMPGMVVDAREDGKYDESVNWIVTMILTTHESDVKVVNESATLLEHLDECKNGLVFVDAVAHKWRVIDSVGDHKSACLRLCGIARCLTAHAGDCKVDESTRQQRGVLFKHLTNALEKRVRSSLASSASSLTDVLRVCLDSLHRLQTSDPDSSVVPQSSVSASIKSLEKLLLPQ